MLISSDCPEASKDKCSSCSTYTTAQPYPSAKKVPSLPPSLPPYLPPSLPSSLPPSHVLDAIILVQAQCCDMAQHEHCEHYFNFHNIISWHLQVILKNMSHYCFNFICKYHITFLISEFSATYMFS